MTTTAPPTHRESPLRLAPPAARQRRWSVAVAGLLVMLGAALAFAVLWMNAGDREPVLAVARAVPAGQEISGRDLAVVRVAADPSVQVIPSSRREEVVGRTAGVDLVPGALLTTGQLGQPTGAEPGEAVVGVALTESQLPVSLRPGDKVAVVDTGAGGGRAGTVLTTARVLGAGPTADGKLLVSLVVAEADAGPVTAVSAAEAVRLYLLPA